MSLLRAASKFRTNLTRHERSLLPLYHQCVPLQLTAVRFYRAEAATFGFIPKEAKPLSFADHCLKHSRKVGKDVLSIHALVKAYRDYGHLSANINPLCSARALPSNASEILEGYGLNHSDLVTNAIPSDSPLLSDGVSNAGQLLDKLHNIYCKDISIELAHMLDSAEQQWFYNEYEKISQSTLDSEYRKEAAILMKESQVFENFLATRFTTIKRYGGDGCQALVSLFNTLFRESAIGGVKQVVIGMPHRGRLNLQATLLKLPVVELFQKMKGMREWPDDVTGSGDILSHLSNSVTLEYKQGSIYATMIPNPSHLEAASPVAAGKTRAKQRLSNDGDYSTDQDRQQSHEALCLQLHGDASFSGQGVIQETFALSGVPHYNVGGSVHIIVNNQLGFTTEAERGRSSEYSSCVSKMNAAPVIHVNGENPDAVMKAVIIAVSYRNKWHRDILIDMMCYRRYGHNELDNPSFTQPAMYKVIDSLQPLPDRYASQLVEEGVCTKEDISEPEQRWAQHLNDQYNIIDTEPPKANHLQKQWAGIVQATDNNTIWQTGVSTDLLRYLAVKSVSTPPDFVAHPTLAKTHIQRRIERTENNVPVDWATAETLAFGSVLAQGYDIRISGQDVGRGTFSHRHVMLVDQETDAMHIPLNDLYEGQTHFLEICNSILSEEAVLGFEYGFSIESPKALTIWEAQFGDFFNGAQIMIDTYISCGDAKWLKQSGLVMLLPTGMDGAGPDHSSCRLERFLQLTDSKECAVDGDSVNMSVVHPTTPAQYFHLLRRQVVRNFRKPLIMAAPKVLIRHPSAVSSLDDMGTGTVFQPVLDDTTVTKAKVTKVIFCSGQHYYNLMVEREKRNIMDTAIVRVEELCPFPAAALQEVASSYPSAQQFVWAQEEHRNYGSWTFVRPRFENLVGVKLKYAGRNELGASATGVGAVHKAECAFIMDNAFAS